MKPFQSRKKKVTIGAQVAASNSHNLQDTQRGSAKPGVPTRPTGQLTVLLHAGWTLATGSLSGSLTRLPLSRSCSPAGHELSSSFRGGATSFKSIGPTSEGFRSDHCTRFCTDNRPKVRKKRIERIVESTTYVESTPMLESSPARLTIVSLQIPLRLPQRTEARSSSGCATPHGYEANIIQMSRSVALNSLDACVLNARGERRLFIEIRGEMASFRWRYFQPLRISARPG